MSNTTHKERVGHAALAACARSRWDLDQGDRCALERAKRAKRAKFFKGNREFSGAKHVRRKVTRKTQGACAGGYCTIIRRETAERWAKELFWSEPRKMADGTMRRVRRQGRKTDNRVVVAR